MFNNKLLTRKFWLWFGWVLVNALGGAIGVLACVGIEITRLKEDQTHAIFALMTAISVSTCQAIFIQKEYMLKQRTAIVTLWIFLSSLCSTLLILAASIIMFVNYFLLSAIVSTGGSGQSKEYLFFGIMFIMFGLQSGIITGIAQYFVIRGAVGKSKKRWILYSGIGCALGLGIAAIIVSLLFKEPIFIADPYKLNTTKSLGMYGMTVFSTIGGTINGAITGIEIVRLFGKRESRFLLVHKE